MLCINTCSPSCSLPSVRSVGKQSAACTLMCKLSPPKRLWQAACSAHGMRCTQCALFCGMRLPEYAPCLHIAYMLCICDIAVCADTHSLIGPCIDILHQLHSCKLFRLHKQQAARNRAHHPCTCKLYVLLTQLQTNIYNLYTPPARDNHHTFCCHPHDTFQ